MTLRDDAKSQPDRLDFVRNSRGADRLTRPIDLARKWSYVMDVRLHKDHLVWKDTQRKRVGRYWLLNGQVARQAIVTRQDAERDGRGILDEFRNLCDAGDEAILRYARTWGVLELCRHNLPSCHEFSLHVPLRLPDPLPTSDKSQGWNPNDPRQCVPLRREPLATWRFFSAQARALLNIAADLQSVQLGDDSHWTMLLSEGIAPARSVDAQRLLLRHVIEGWLKLGRIKPAIDDLTGGLTWTGADLFGELAVQIALAAEARDGQVVCVSCGKPYEPKRRVIRRGFNYCPATKCQRAAAAKRAQRYRNRKCTSGRGISTKLPYRGLFQGRTNDPLFSQ